MSIGLSAILICLLFILFYFSFKSLEERALYFVFTVSTLYFGILGIIYWAYVEDGWFIGSNWKPELLQLPMVYALVYSIVGSCCFFAQNFLGPIRQTRESDRQLSEGFESAALVVSGAAALGILAAALVVLRALSTNDFDPHNAGPFFLILYQTADILIPVVIYISIQDSVPFRKTAITAFFAYAVLTGLRYKIALVAGPLLLFYLFSPNVLKSRKLLAVLASLLLVLFFAVLTITRVKFSGLDFETFEWSRLGYGFFAETNCNFGLSSALKYCGEKFPFAGLKPLLEIFEQFIPRFLHPEKNVGAHLLDFKLHIAMSKQSAESGTSIPFFGEYYIMSGWAGVVIGTMAYSLLAYFSVRFAGSVSVNEKQSLMSGCFISVVFGQYCYSRGSVVVLAVTFAFIVLPYFMFLLAQRRSG